MKHSSKENQSVPRVDTYYPRVSDYQRGIIQIADQPVVRLTRINLKSEVSLNFIQLSLQFPIDLLTFQMVLLLKDLQFPMYMVCWPLRFHFTDVNRCVKLKEPKLLTNYYLLVRFA